MVRSRSPRVGTAQAPAYGSACSSDSSPFEGLAAWKQAKLSIPSQALVPGTRWRPFLHGLIASLSLLSVSCSQIGPGTIANGRFDYNEAIVRSFDDQMLLNLVRLRYQDSILFLDLTSVVASYSREATRGCILERERRCSQARQHRLRCRSARRVASPGQNHPRFLTRRCKARISPSDCWRPFNPIRFCSCREVVGGSSDS